jgi:hypothetical protein
VVVGHVLQVGHVHPAAGGVGSTGRDEVVAHVEVVVTIVEGPTGWGPSVVVKGGLWAEGHEPVGSHGSHPVPPGIWGQKWASRHKPHLMQPLFFRPFVLKPHLNDPHRQSRLLG